MAMVLVDLTGDILTSEVRRAPNFGEPTQEKVVFYRDYTNTIWRKLCHYATAVALHLVVV